MRSKLTTSLTSILFLMITTFILYGCGQNSNNAADRKNDPLKGKITISGAFALYPLTVKWSEEFRKIHPNVTINVSAGGAGKGMADALSRMVDLGMYSKEVSPEEKAKGAWTVAVAKDAVLPTINAENPVLKELKIHGLTKEKLASIFLSGNMQTWGGLTGTKSTVTVQPFTRSDACGASEMWAKYLGQKKQEDLLGLGVNGDPGVADAVRKNPSGIGYNNLNFIYDMQSRKVYNGLDVVPIDINENGIIDPAENFYATLDDVMKAIKDGKYPSPPARDLYFVAAGKPTDKTVLAFLQWVLTEGQKYLTEAGYVTVSEEKLKAGLAQVN
ncbi:MAG: PstS family phosphate ABC transporter substrate-binding protein [Bacteroidetes bacterium]|nr:PstS family phosphate ABC transporter substrate-binding protein [Bacteroidota bacterium]